MQVWRWTGNPLCLHPLGNTLKVLLWKNNLDWKTGSHAWVQLGQTLLSEMSFRMSGELSLATLQWKLSGKWSDWNSFVVHGVQGRLGGSGEVLEEGWGGFVLAVGGPYQIGLIPIFTGE